MGGAARRGAILAVAVVLFAVTLLPMTSAEAQERVVVPAGTTVPLRMESSLNSRNARPGETFKATVLTPATINGVDAIPEGSTVTGRVIAVHSAKAWGEASGVTIQPDSLTSPAGSTVNIVGDLLSANGSALTTVDNLPAGTRLQLRINRGLAIDQSFYGGQDVFNSVATIRQAQVVLRDLGYYSGAITGRMTPDTRAALVLFQRSQNIRATGFLDQLTLNRLGLISQGGGEVSPANVISANAVERNNRLDVHITAQGAKNRELFEDHFRFRDAMHIYVREYDTATRPQRTGDLTVTLQPNEYRDLNRIVIHGTGNDIVIRQNEIGRGSISPEEAAQLEAQISNLVQQYASALGLRYSRYTGQIEFSQRVNYRENETELLFALNSLATTAHLYTQLLRTSNDPQAIAGASDILVMQANAVERAVSRTKSGRATQVVNGWATLRDDFQRIDDASSRNFKDLPAYR